MKQRTYVVSFRDKEMLKIDADKVEFYQVPDSGEVMLLLLLDSQIIGVVRHWDGIRTVAA